jgi:hypothetical protein
LQRVTNPEYYDNNPDYQLPDDHPVDVVIPAFLKGRILEAVNKLSSSRVYTMDDMLDYGKIPSKEGMYRLLSVTDCMLTG